MLTDHQPLPIQIPVRKIAIVRALHLGDLLLAVPAMRALRKRFPEAEITLVGLPWAVEFVRRFSAYVDRWVEFPGFPGMLEVEANWERTKRFLKESRAYGYDLAVQMHGDGSISNKFTVLLGARLTVGFQKPGTRSPRGMHTLPYPEGSKEVLKHLKLVQTLGASPEDHTLEFPLRSSDFDELGQILEVSELEREKVVVINPGARPPARRWRPEHFACLADRLVAEHGVRVVLCGGKGEENLSQAVKAAMRSEALDLSGKTSIGCLGALLSKAKLAILNDSGPAHMAVALGIPSVALFGAADPQRWAPIDQTINRIIYKGVDCSPCPHWVCPVDHRCMNRITVEEVLSVARELLANTNTLEPQGTQRPQREL